MERARILIVEDEAIVAQDLRKVLESLGYVVVADMGSGEAAVAQAEALHPDLILMDIVLRGAMDGVAAARVITELLDIPVIFLTAYADDETLERAKVSGPFGYVLKPFQKRELHTHIQMALHKHGLERQLRESEARYRLLAQNATDLIWSLDDRLQPLYLSPSVERFLGYPVAEAMTMGLMRVLTPESRARLRALMSDGATQFPETVILEYRRKDGSRVWGESKITYQHTDETGRYTMMGVTRDITERQRYETALARSNQELAQFAYVISHDLREPLRMITGFLRLLEERYAPQLDAEAQEFIHYAAGGAARLQAMIKALLQYSRVGTRGAKFEPVDCERLLQVVLVDLRISIEESGAVVTHDPLPTVIGDKVQLSQVFQNLLSNAIKFRGEEAPRVHVSASRQESAWQFAVRDHGIGIDPAQIPRLFQIFQRLHTPEEYPGSGIGLALCKKIVMRHGGEIWVSSKPGRGSTFYFTLPA